MTASLGIGFVDIVQLSWFSQILDYSGPNIHLQEFEQGLNLIVETPFIVAAVIGVFLNVVLPREGSEMDRQSKLRDEAGNPGLERKEDNGD
jgi:xanthine/uracil permease